MTVPREQPSWLMLERYALGELPERERLAVQQMLANDPASAACVMRIQSDTRELPPLPRVERPAAATPTTFSSRFASSWLGWRFGVAALVTVAAIGLVVLNGQRAFAPFASSVPNASSSVKGDAIAISLVRERDGSVAWDPTVFGLHDRFKVRVTCAELGSVFATVVVYQGGTASFPIESQAIACGNDAVLNGAFRLSESSPARVCVALSANAPVRRELLEAGVSAVDAACMELTPTP